jgi:hypothetical protein
MRRFVSAGILAVTAMQLGGCAVVPWSKEPGLGYVVTEIKGDPAPYVLYERGWEKRVYSATATWSAYLWLLPFGFIEGGQMGDRLFDHPVQWWECLAAYEMSWGPRERSVGMIKELAEWTAPAPFWNGNDKQTEAQQRWILGNVPLVIAIGTDKVILDPIKYDYRSTWSLVRQTELDRTATELVIIDQWPPDWSDESPKGTDQDKRYEALLAKISRRVPFQHPMTLREIFARRLWEPRASSETITSQQ